MILRERLIRYFRNNPGFHASGDIQRLVMEKTKYTPSNASRRLRELAEEGILEVEIRKGHAFYKFKQQLSLPELQQQSLHYFNQLPN